MVNANWKMIQVHFGINKGAPITHYLHSLNVKDKWIRYSLKPNSLFYNHQKITAENAENNKYVNEGVSPKHPFELHRSQMG